MIKNIVIAALSIIILIIFLNTDGSRAKDGEPESQLCFSIYDRCALQCMLDRVPENKENIKN